MTRFINFFIVTSWLVTIARGAENEDILQSCVRNDASDEACNNKWRSPEAIGEAPVPQHKWKNPDFIDFNEQFYEERFPSDGSATKSQDISIVFMRRIVGHLLKATQWDTMAIKNVIKNPTHLKLYISEKELNTLMDFAAEGETSLKEVDEVLENVIRSGEPLWQVPTFVEESFTNLKYYCYKAYEFLFHEFHFVITVPLLWFMIAITIKKRSAGQALMSTIPIIFVSGFCTIYIEMAQEARKDPKYGSKPPLMHATDVLSNIVAKSLGQIFPFLGKGVASFVENFNISSSWWASVTVLPFALWFLLELLKSFFSFLMRGIFTGFTYAPQEQPTVSSTQPKNEGPVQVHVMLNTPFSSQLRYNSISNQTSESSKSFTQHLERPQSSSLTNYLIPAPPNKGAGDCPSFENQTFNENTSYDSSVFRFVASKIDRKGGKLGSSDSKLLDVNKAFHRVKKRKHCV